MKTEDQIDDAICNILRQHGPDGHVDGHDKLTEFVMGLQGKCMNCQHWGGGGYCQHPKLNPFVPNELPPDCATGDGEWIQTGPEFGCIHFEAK